MRSVREGLCKVLDVASAGAAVSRRTRGVRRVGAKMTAMGDASADSLQELGFFQEPYWRTRDSDLVKSLLLFFDGVALLTPDYMRDRPFEMDPSLAEPLADQGLLHILSPEQLVDEQIAVSLADLFEGLLTSGSLDDLDRNLPFAEISNSRLGLDVSPTLMNPLVELLRERGLARTSDDGVSVPVHQAVRNLVLGTLGQLLRAPAEKLGYALQPLGNDDYSAVTPGLLRLLDRAPMPTAGRVVISDFQQVGFDLSAIPLDEVLAFRAEHGFAYRAYARDLRAFVQRVATADEGERDAVYADRREALSDAAVELNRHARKAWRRQMASFGLGIGGSAVALVAGNPVGAGLAFASGFLGLKRQADPASVYTYLFNASRAWPPASRRY